LLLRIVLLLQRYEKNIERAIIIEKKILKRLFGAPAPPSEAGKNNYDRGQVPVIILRTG